MTLHLQRMEMKNDEENWRRLSLLVTNFFSHQSVSLVIQIAGTEAMSRKISDAFTERIFPKEDFSSPPA